MAILKIARMGHPVLRAPAEPVEDPAAPEIRRLIDDMMETLADADGRGLAAPQVHVPLRLIMFHLPGGEEEDEDEDGEDLASKPPTVLINPVIEPEGDEASMDWEGCLSLPGMIGLVPRHAAIRYHGIDADGNPVDRRAEGFSARVVQHEFDHLDGILYPQRMPDLSLLGFVEEMRQGLAARREEEEKEDDD
jgi:peptide deformylase